MARYAYSCESEDGRCLLYLESTTEEEKADRAGNQTMVGFTGNGYLAFWKRCKEAERELHGKRHRSVITDTYTGEEKVW